MASRTMMGGGGQGVLENVQSKTIFLVCFYTQELPLGYLSMNNKGGCRTALATPHIVPCGKFHRIRGAPPKTFPNVKYDAPEEVGGNRKCFDSPIRK